MQNSTLPWPDIFPPSLDRSSLPKCKSVATCQQPPPNVFSPYRAKKKIPQILSNEYQHDKTNIKGQRMQTLFNRRSEEEKKKDFFGQRLFPTVCPKETTRRSLSSSRCKIYRHLGEEVTPPLSTHLFMGTGLGAFFFSLSNLTLILITHKKKRLADRVSFFFLRS